MERPSYSAGSLKIVMGFTLFFAVGCASESYVVCIFVGSGGGKGSFTVLCFCIKSIIISIFLYVLAIQNRFFQVQFQKSFLTIFF